MTDKKKKTIQQEFDEKLKEFYEEKNYIKEYERFTPLGDKILVKMFRFIPEKNTEDLGKTQIWVKSPLTGEFKPSNQALNEKVFPIVKVLKVGVGVDKSFISEGKLYTVPLSEVDGMDWNPDFLHLMNTFSQQGKAPKANLPEDMPQKIPKLERNWERYIFAMPDRIGNKTEEDKLVYLIPSLKLESIYEYN